ncbi:hypothetical protein AVEN_258159-1 [Araneus ventricosus]|uniref:Uncharacterized protein n=1 Tax=Araneus ventricosus TaxID=182803 RepID=A0A4Y2KCD4_ARAVE|nr:hypothetical protein AVEN_258159-1 [Araneus ventricosus]
MYGSNTMAPLRTRCPTVHSGHIPATSHRVGGCPSSPDLNPLDFFLWGYIRRRVYATPPPTLQELRNRIADAACRLLCCTMCSGKCSPVSKCVLLLKDTILSMTDR